jgi:hypothetical protein
MSQAVDLKNQGNKAFTSGDFPRAIELYSGAIKLDSTQPAFFTNRAQVCTPLWRFPTVAFDRVTDQESAL